jgi:HlyD family secretion protein
MYFYSMLRALFVITTLLLFQACKNKQETTSPVIQNISESVYASGIIKSKNQYQAYAKVNGVIESIFVSEGDSIKKGQSILSIANAAQKLNEENAQLAAEFADFNANTGKLNDAKLMVELAMNKMKTDSALYQRQKNLWVNNIGTKVELEQKELMYQNSKAAYYSSVVRYGDLKRQLDFTSSQSKKNLLISKELVDDYTLKSEIDGIVYLINKSVGELVGPQTAVAVVGSATDFVLEMQIDEYDILKIKNGQTVLVSMDSYKGKVFEARVTKINPIMNERSKTFMVEAEFTQKPEKLYPHITFEANIIQQSKENVMLIPRNYLIHDSIAMLESGEKVIIKTGLKDYNYVEVLKGLNKTDVLVKPTE